MPFRQKMCICMTDSITMNSNVYWHLDDSDSPGNVMPALSKITCNLSYVQYVIMQMIASVPEGLDLVQPVGLCPDRQTGKQTAHRGCNLRFRRVTQKILLLQSLSCILTIAEVKTNDHMQARLLHHIYSITFKNLFVLSLFRCVKCLALSRTLFLKQNSSAAVISQMCGFLFMCKGMMQCRSTLVTNADGYCIAWETSRMAELQDIIAAVDTGVNIKTPVSKGGKLCRIWGHV